MVKIGVLIAAALFVSVAILCKPEFFSSNTFLVGFVNHEVISLMAVILTVTLASVANIHLAINRLVKERFDNSSEAISLASDVKSELRQNCWFIFWGFLCAIILVFAKGALPANPTAIAIVHGAISWILLLYVMCMMDVYQVVFGIVSMDKASQPEPEVVPTEGP